MILKRPYAFLIKHFRLIHLILALPLIYITRKTHIVVNFFNEYVKNSYSFQTGSDISGIYISGLMLFSIFIIIVAILSIYFLLKYKEKPVKMYVIMMIYYIILFIMLYYLSNVISSMSREVLSAKTARLYRDISIIIYVPQYIFVVFTTLRAIGFNIKQFNFKSDLKELEITSEDNEEVEVGFELDGYKTKRFFRRFKREFNYYLIENKLMVSVVVILFIFSSILIYYYTRRNYDISYTQNNTFLHQGFSINVKDSIITNLTHNGRMFSDEHHYLVLKTNIVNNMSKKTKLDYTSFVLNVNGKEYKPVLDKSTYFIDYGSPYYGEYIKPNRDTDYVLVYKLDDSDINKSMKLKVLSEFYMSKNKLVTKYAVVNLTPVVVDKIIDIMKYNVSDKVNLSNTNVGSSILQVNSFERTNSYKYNYEICFTKDNCTTKTDIATIDYSKGNSNSSLLVLDYDFDLDQETAYAKYTFNDLDFFKDFVTIKDYSSMNQSEYSVINITPKNLKNKLILQVSGNILNSQDLDMFITIRNKRYTINLI